MEEQCSETVLETTLEILIKILAKSRVPSTFQSSYLWQKHKHHGLNFFMSEFDKVTYLLMSFIHLR